MSDLKIGDFVFIVNTNHAIVKLHSLGHIISINYHEHYYTIVSGELEVKMLDPVLFYENCSWYFHHYDVLPYGLMSNLEKIIYNIPDQT